MLKQPQHKVNKPRKISYSERLAQYLSHHKDCLRQSVQQMMLSPMASALTLLVIGIALALPAAMHILLSNAKQLTNTWEGPQELSLYLQQRLTSQDIQVFQAKLQKKPNIVRTHLISKEAALESLTQRDDMYQVVRQLPENPLPDVIVVIPKPSLSNQELIELRKQLEALDAVDSVALDLAWLKKIHALMLLARQTTHVLMLFIAVAILIICGNTIRLMIEHHRQEIEVLKLIGATHAFVKRPFIYLGACYGLIGGLIACGLTLLGLWLLSSAVNQLAIAYNSNFQLYGLSLEQALIVILSSIFLSMLAAWLAVTRELKSIHPC